MALQVSHRRRRQEDSSPYRDLLGTKLRRPLVAEDVIPRPHLEAALSDGLRSKLILVAAPAGYGKTTLLSAWLEGTGRPAAWLSLDQDDNDVTGFLKYLTATVQSVVPAACPRTVASLGSQHRQPVQALTAGFIAELGDIRESLVLVLDDYHLITAPAVHDLVRRVIEQGPDSLQVVMTARRNPPLPLARWRGRRVLTEIRATDLRLDRHEAARALASMLGREVPAELSDALAESTEGWVTGLRLAAITLRRQPNAVALAQTFRHPGTVNVRDYLFDEVMKRQTPGLQEFLLKTSVLDRFCAPLCEAVLHPARGTSSVQRRIDAAMQQDLFVTPLDEHGEWYRYHHLFGEMLRHRLRATSGRAAVADLHRRAAIWYDAQGYVEDAIHHALAAADDALSAAVVERHMHEALNREDRQALERWLALLPAPLVASRPALLVARAFVHHFQSALGAIPPLLEQAESLLPRPGGQRHDTLLQETRSAIALLRGQGEYSVGDFARGLKSVERAVALAPRRCVFVQALATFYRCLLLQITGRLDLAERELLRALDEHSGEASAHTTRALFGLLAIYRAEGDLVRAEQAARRLLHHAVTYRVPLSEAWARLVLGHVHLEWNHLDRAVEHYAAGAALDLAAHVRTVHECLVGLVLANAAQGKMDDAEGHRQRLVQLVESLGLSAGEALSLGGRLALLRGDLEAADGWAASEITAPKAPQQWLESPLLTRARIDIASRSPARVRRAVRDLGTFLRVAKAQHSTRRIIEIQALRALALWTLERNAQALTTLGTALSLGRPGGFVRTFADLGPDAAEMFRELSARGGPRDYISRILAVMRGVRAHEPPSGPARPTPDATLLTYREAEVLRLMAGRLSNKEIARELVISTYTVKRHCNNIFTKLHAENRREAVVLAQARGLLP